METRVYLGGDYICPYCGSTYNVMEEPLTKDHIVPKAFWRYVRNTSDIYSRRHKLNIGIQTKDDDRNIMMVCCHCNRSKNDSFWVPDWRIDGNFKNCPRDNLRVHASYFYEWSDCFIEALNTSINRWNDYMRMHEGVNVIVSEAQNKIRELTLLSLYITQFREEYKIRFKKDLWDIGSSVGGLYEWIY